MAFDGVVSKTIGEQVKYLHPKTVVIHRKPKQNKLMSSIFGFSGENRGDLNVFINKTMMSS